MTPRLTINLGLRWDYESDMLNNDYVTPDAVRAATAPFVDASRYFTDGSDRPPFYGAWQPRLGFSYDVTGSGKTVVFGGWGRYYDRVLYNYTLDERFRLQFAVRTFRFSADGAPRDGNQTIVWNPSYLSQTGLDGLIASGVAPNPEVFLIDNETRPPVSDQFSLGVRQRVGPVTLSASYSGVRSRNGFTFLFGNRRPDGNCCQGIPGFSNILISSDAKKAWYDALFFQADKPLGGERLRYGYSLTYTLGRAEQNGGDLFSLDFPTVEQIPALSDRRATSATAWSRPASSAAPWDVFLSTLITLGSGTPYNIDDQRARRRHQRAALHPQRRRGPSSSTSSSRTPGPTAASTCAPRSSSSSTAGSASASRSRGSTSSRSTTSATTTASSRRRRTPTRCSAGRATCSIPGGRLQFGLRYGF